MIKIKVPATTANLGPGFDTLGVALNLFNHINVSKDSSGNRCVLWESDVIGVSDSENYVKETLDKVLDKYGQPEIGYELIMADCQIPISRGLGSSAASIVAGIFAANYLLDFRLSTQDMIHLATEIEGHPDNVVPAILGDMVISCYDHEQNKVFYSIVDFPDELLFKVLIPDFKVSTRDARRVLPVNYTLNQCVSNISRVSMLINSLNTRNYDLLKFSLKDEIHEPFRIKLIHESDVIVDKLKKVNSLGSFISGAGPTLIGLVKYDNIEFDMDFIPFLKSLKNNWDLKSITVNKSGTTYEIIE